MQTWYDERARRTRTSSRRSSTASRARPGPRGLQGHRRTHATRATAPSPSSGTRRPSTRASGSRPRSAGACSATCSATRPTARRDIPRCSRTPRCGSCRSSTSTATTRRSSARTRACGAGTCATTTATTCSTGNDGVDTNRNWAEKWRYDQEGASDDFGSDTYRGPSAQSEPEVSSLDAMFAQAQAEVPARLPLLRAADPLPRGLAGRDAEHRHAGDDRARGLDDDHPAIADFDPDVSGELYTTNGDVTGHALQPLRHAGLHGRARRRQRPGRRRHRRRARTRSPPGGFVFQDSEAAVEEEFQRNLAVRARPRALGQEPGPPGVAPRQRRRRTSCRRTFKVSYGDPQTVEVNANRDLGPVEVHWRVNGGAVQLRADDRVQGRRALRPARRLLPQAARPRSPASQPGDKVEVWFSRGQPSTSDAVHVQGREVDSPATCS